MNRLEENLDYWRTMSRFATSLSASLGALALLIASIGVYGVVSYTGQPQAARSRDSHGARGHRWRHAAHDRETNASPGHVGALVGIAAAAAVSRILEAVLFGISAFDPIAFVLAPMFLLAVSVAASLAPARRAMRVDPMSTLRYD